MLSATIPHHPQHIETVKRGQRLKRMACAALTVSTVLAATITVTAEPAQAACHKGQVVTGVKFLSPRESSDQSGEPRDFTLSEGPALIFAVGKKLDSKIALTIPATGRFLCQPLSKESHVDENVAGCRVLVRGSDLPQGQRARKFDVIVKNNSTEDTLEYSLICVNEPGDLRKFF